MRNLNILLLIAFLVQRGTHAQLFQGGSGSSGSSSAVAGATSTGIAPSNPSGFSQLPTLGSGGLLNTRQAQTNGVAQATGVARATSASGAQVLNQPGNTGSFSVNPILVQDLDSVLKSATFANSISAANAGSSVGNINGGNGVYPAQPVNINYPTGGGVLPGGIAYQPQQYPQYLQYGPPQQFVPYQQPQKYIPGLPIGGYPPQPINTNQAVANAAANAGTITIAQNAPRLPIGGYPPQPINTNQAIANAAANAATSAGTLTTVQNAPRPNNFAYPLPNAFVQPLNNGPAPIGPINPGPPIGGYLPQPINTNQAIANAAANAEAITIVQNAPRPPIGGYPPQPINTNQAIANAAANAEAITIVQNAPPNVIVGDEECDRLIIPVEQYDDCEDIIVIPEEQDDDCEDGLVILEDDCDKIIIPVDQENCDENSLLDGLDISNLDLSDLFSGLDLGALLGGLDLGNLLGGLDLGNLLGGLDLGALLGGLDLTSLLSGLNLGSPGDSCSAITDIVVLIGIILVFALLTVYFYVTAIIAYIFVVVVLIIAILLNLTITLVGPPYDDSFRDFYIAVLDTFGYTRYFEFIVHLSTGDFINRFLVLSGFDGLSDTLEGFGVPLYDVFETLGLSPF